MEGSISLDPTATKAEFYSRQLYVFSQTELLKIESSRVLIVGLKGLGFEIAKNLVLSGVGSVTLHDDAHIVSTDLSAQYFLREEDVGRRRAEACVELLAEMNPYVSIAWHTGPLDMKALSAFSVVVETEAGLDRKQEVSDWCHQHGIAFLAAEAHGAFGSVFCDFGEGHVVLDWNGEPLLKQSISSVTRANPGVVTVSDDHLLQFKTGDLVKFVGVRGMTQLNDSPPCPITVLGPHKFSIGIDTTDYDEYQLGGEVLEVKASHTVRFLPLREALKQPSWVNLNDGKQHNRQAQLHLGLQALDLWVKLHHGFFPDSYHLEHAQQVVDLAKELNASAKLVEEIDEGLIKSLAYGSRGELTPIISFIGGVAAQEVLKACTGKFTPIHQWLYFDAVEALPSDDDLDPAHFQTERSRYDGQVAVLGREVQRRLGQQQYFLAGLGAIGGELLKIWAAMGVAASPEGCIHVADGDTIKRADLNQQFLLRTQDIGKPKAEVVAEAVRKINPKTNIRAYSLRVGPESEEVFDDKFYRSLTGVVTALDNVRARLYMDSQCIQYCKPMVDAGINGTKGSTQVILPQLTEAYSSSSDPPDYYEYPVAEVCNFPTCSSHAVTGARHLFDKYFTRSAELVNDYLSQPEDFIASLRKQQSPEQQLEVVQDIHHVLKLVAGPSVSVDQCVAWARLLFEELFHDRILQLLHSFPHDRIVSNGRPFWAAPKRLPSPISFNPDDPVHVNFITSAANLRAANFGLGAGVDDTAVRVVLKDFVVPEFTLRTLNAQKQGPEWYAEQVERLLRELPPRSTIAEDQRLTPLMFACDDMEDRSNNYHMAFITATSCLRARNYSLEELDARIARKIVGKITPTLVTTAAVVAGLASLELLKLIQGKDKSAYRNGFLNLALPFLALSEPIAPSELADTPDDTRHWTLWDRFGIAGPLTLRQFLAIFESEHKLKLSLVCYGTIVLYSVILHGRVERFNERMDMEISHLVKMLCKQPLPKGKKYLCLELCADGGDGEDARVPPAHYYYD